MKKVPLLLMFVHFTNIVCSQTFRINVTDDKEPLCYAYIYANNKYIGISDSNGQFEIPLEKINLGDSISASFVGYDNNYFIVDENIKKESKYTINLTSNILIDEVIVTVDAEEMYKKYTKRLPFYHYGSKQIIDYTYKIKVNNNSIKDESGSLSLVYLYKRDKENVGKILKAYANPVGENKVDTSFNNKLIISCHNAISYTSQYYDYILKGIYGNDKTLKYKGVSNNCRIFTAITKRGKTSTQIVCYFDKESKNLTYFELDMIEFDDKGNVVIEKKSKFNIAFKKTNIIANEYHIDNISETIKYKNLTLETNLNLKIVPWKFDKKIEWGVVTDTKELLDAVLDA